MAKIGEKEAQRRAMRERTVQRIVDPEVYRAAWEGHSVPVIVSKTRIKFDKVTYQREYMRKRRAAQKAERSGQ